jgi:ATP-dependent helicase/nuclease subunit A
MPIASQTPADIHIRKQALDISQSFAVSAPAGSGKTSLLVQRILRLLAISERPEEILAITFTRKAAAEMRHRILEALRDAAADAEIEDEHQKSLREDALKVLQRDTQQGWNLLENPERLRLQTIDGFCSYLTQRLSLETGISHPGSLIERPADHYRQAAEQLLTHINRQDQLGQAVRHLVGHFEGNQDSLALLLADLLDSRANWLDLVLHPEFGQDQLIQNFRSLIEGELTALRRQLVHIDMAELRSLFDYSQIHHPIQPGAESIQFSDKAYCFDRYLSIWQAMASMLLTGGGTVRKRVDKRDGFPAKSTGAEAAEMQERIKDFLAVLEDQPELVLHLKRVQALPQLNAGDKKQTLTALATCLPVLAAELKLIFAGSGEADFSAISISALEALGEPENPTRLNLRLDYRIRHILVDEFQDTSSLQVSLLERLMAGWEPGDGRTLFLVGDAMQSIYGFRKANVSLFIRAREMGIGATHPNAIDLETNFRSAPSLVEWVNHSFEAIMPGSDDRTRGQVAYRTSIAQKAVDPKSGVSLRGFNNNTAEAEQIADSILEELQDADRSIAILVRARSHLRDLLPALKAKNISWQAQKIEPLGQRMHVLDMHSLVRALHSPADRIAWLALLRSPMLGLDMSDLFALCNGSDQAASQSNNIWSNIQNASANAAISAEGKNQLSRLQTSFSDAQLRLGILNLRDLVEFVWRQLGGDQSLFKSSYQQDLDDYLNLLQEQCKGELIFDLESFEKELDQLYARPDTETDCQLKIMTIHAAKGLEFDSVYLPQLQRGGGGAQRNPALVWQEREFADGHTAFLAAARPSNNTKDPIYEWLLSDERERIRDESSRLLYVACTRAKTQLNLSGVVSFDEAKEEWKAPSSNSLLALLWDQYQEEFCSGLEPLSFQEEEDEVPVLSGIRRLANPPQLDQSSPDQQIEEPPENLYCFEENLLQRLVGKHLHHALMLVAQGESREVEQYRESWQLELRLSGLDQESQAEALQRLDQAFRNATESKFGQWVLNPEHKDSACELEVEQLFNNGSLARSILDRTFIETDKQTGKNIRWIIDYKSATPSSTQSPEDFLSYQENKYRGQLARYRSLFEDEMPVKTLLYFPAANLHCEVVF